MPKYLFNRWHGLHVIWSFLLIIALIVALAMYEWVLAIIGLCLCSALVYYTMRAEKAFREDFDHYVSMLSHRVKRAGKEIINELPLGMLMYNEEDVVEWHNPYMGKMFDRDSLIGATLDELFAPLHSKKDKASKVEITINDKVYEVAIKGDERLVFVHDITAYSKLYKQHKEDKITIGIVMLDNLDEFHQGMDDQTRSIALAGVTGEITGWARKYQLYLRRTSADKFLFICNQKSLKGLEQSRFDILDDVRDMTIEHKVPLTLSIGVAAGMDDLAELGSLAQSSLDMALGRGGDQVAVKVGQHMAFYGGRSNAVERRTRVRARVISHALRDLITESDKVIIMGHRLPDMDALGAALGVRKAAQLGGKEGFIVLEGVNPSIQKWMELFRDDEKTKRAFITPEQAMQMMTPRTLAVVVDTHKAAMVAEPKLLTQTHRIVVIDHHRRGEDFLTDALLVYMEPYASSTCELVTELLQYFQEPISMDVLESTALLAGIVVDTKSFSLRTGARTFEAASFLRRNGADSALIQRMLKEDLNEYMRKVEIIRHAETIYDHIALAVAEPNRKYPQLLIAQVADTLLNMTDVMASFVISERSDGLIGISARSLGQMNVQVVMERLGGGGHLTNAATQLEGSLEEVTEQLKQVLTQMEEEEGLFE